MLRVSLVTLLSVYFLCEVKARTLARSVVVLLSKDNENTSNVSFHLSQPKDIIAGACLAAHHINKLQDSLHPLQVLPLLVSDSDHMKAVPELLETLLDPEIEVIGVAGILLKKLEEFYNPIIIHLDEKIPQKYGSSYFSSFDKDAAQAIMYLFKELNWTRASIIQSDNYRYGKVANYIKTAMNTTAYDFITLEKNTIGATIQIVKYGRSKILVLLAPPQLFSSVIYKAVQQDVVWPDYVWVVVHLELATVNLSSAWENILLITYKSPTLDCSNTTCAENTSSTSNFDSSLLYNEVWQLVIGNNIMSITNSSILARLSPVRDTGLLFVLNI